MIGRFIDGQLKKHLAKYVDGSFESSFNHGDVTLTNLKLKESVLPASSPLRLAAGFVGRVHVEIPLINIGNTPIKVSVDDVMVLLKPREREVWDEAKEVELLRSRKLARAKKETTAANKEAKEQQQQRAAAAGTPGSSSSGPGTGTGAGDRISTCI